MPGTRKSKTNTNTPLSLIDSTIEFTKQLQNIQKKSDDFMKSVDDFNKLRENNFQNLELNLKQKQIELEELEKKFKETERQRKLDVDLNIKQYQYEEALKILEERGEIAVKKIEYKELESNYNNSVEKAKSEVKSAIENEKRRNNEYLKTMKETLELKNKAEVAKVEAQLEAQNKEIKALNNTIERLEKDIDEQRKLTKDVAQAAASKSSHMYIPQTSGNSRH